MNQTRVWWSRLSPIQRVGLIAAALVLPCCGGVTAVSALSGDPAPVTGEISGAPVAEQLADAPETSATTSATDGQAGVTTKTVTERKAIAYATRTVDDDRLAQGRTKVRKQGRPGVRTLTYEVTLTDGKETGRKLVSDVVTKKPVTKVVALGTNTPVPPSGGCDPNYDPCVPIAQDVDCEGGSGDGPAYVDGPIRVVREDVYDLDRDGDGVACDS